MTSRTINNAGFDVLDISFDFFLWKQQPALLTSYHPEAPATFRISKSFLPTIVWLMAVHERVMQQFFRICATDFGGGSSIQRSGFAELCFPSFDLDDFYHGVVHHGPSSDDAVVPRVQIMDEPNLKQSTDFILDAVQMHQVASFVLPKELKLRRWKRSFSLARDGPSFEECMEKINGEQQTLLVVTTNHGEMFGGYSDARWDFNSGTYHGGEKSKLFSFVTSDRRSTRSLHSIDDSAHSYQSNQSTTCFDARDDCEETKEKKGSLSVYSWSGLNRDFQYCDSSRSLLAFGGGGARFGLSIEQNFKVGTTAPCDTFTNDKLGSSERFQIMDLEIWSFVVVEESCCSMLCCQQLPALNPQEDITWIPPVRVVRERLRPEHFILDQAKMNLIARYVFPQTVASCQWKRAYSLARDGDCFDTCLHMCRRERRSLMVIRTPDGQIFGGYADSPWKAFHCNYYGSAQACLWKFTNTQEQESAVVAADQLKVYKWTGMNRYIQFCDVTHRILAFGGGGDEGTFGLCIEQDFQKGFTGKCATFGNDPLCEQEHFKIVDLEIWGLLTGEF